MPLLDHFHPPLSTQRHWQGFHSAWASAIVSRLNSDLLPQRYFAEPNVQWSGAVEIDVATFVQDSRTIGQEELDTGTAVWAPPQPTKTIPLDWSGPDVAEVRVFSDEGGPELVAAIELVSPANKDREAHRSAFAMKCAAQIQQGISVVIVDAVTSRGCDLYAEVLNRVNSNEEETINRTGLFAAAFRAVTGNPCTLDIWRSDLKVGEDLPTLPLWLEPELSVPLDLEQSYMDTCQSLRISI